MKFRILIISFLATSAITFTGCSELKPEGMPVLYPVKIAVVQDGQPLENASVLLIPLESENYRWNSGGLTNRAGIAQLKVDGKYKGVPQGNFHVSISKTITDPVPTDAGPFFKPDAYDTVDPKFSDAPGAETIEVRPGQQKSWTIDVGKSVRIMRLKR